MTFPDDKLRKLSRMWGGCAGGRFDLIIKFMLFSKFPSFLVIITPVLAPLPALSETNPAPVLHRYRYQTLFPRDSLLISNYIALNLTKDGNVWNLLRTDEESWNKSGCIFFHQEFHICLVPRSYFLQVFASYDQRAKFSPQNPLKLQKFSS